MNMIFPLIMIIFYPSSWASDVVESRTPKNSINLSAIETFLSHDEKCQKFDRRMSEDLSSSPTNSICFSDWEGHLPWNSKNSDLDHSSGSVSQESEEKDKLRSIQDDAAKITYQVLADPQTYFLTEHDSTWWVDDVLVLSPSNLKSRESPQFVNGRLVLTIQFCIDQKDDLQELQSQIDQAYTSQQIRLLKECEENVTSRGECQFFTKVAQVFKSKEQEEEDAYQAWLNQIRSCTLEQVREQVKEYLECDSCTGKIQSKVNNSSEEIAAVSHIENLLNPDYSHYLERDENLGCTFWNPYPKEIEKRQTSKKSRRDQFTEYACDRGLENLGYTEAKKECHHQLQSDFQEYDDLAAHFRSLGGTFDENDLCRVDIPNEGVFSYEDLKKDENPISATIRSTFHDDSMEIWPIGPFARSINSVSQPKEFELVSTAQNLVKECYRLSKMYLYMENPDVIYDDKLEIDSTGKFYDSRTHIDADTSFREHYDSRGDDIEYIFTDLGDGYLQLEIYLKGNLIGLTVTSDSNQSKIINETLQRAYRSGF